jgi:L-threonylcarbamoyladenylate synthase
VAFPTDTFYGIAADPRSDSAVRRLLRAKGRKEPPPLIAAGLDQVKHVAKLSGLAAQLASHFWPGPLTLVLPTRPGRLCRAVVRSGTIAIRVPRHPVARALAKALGSPLTATSANRTGRPPARSASQVEKNLGAEISLIIDGGFSAASSPSTIVASGRGRIEVVRQGCIAAKQISKFLDGWSDDC